MCFVAFDVLHLDGRDVCHLGYTERRGLLETLRLTESAWRVTPSHPGEGAALFEATLELGLEGVVAKALHSPYRLEGGRGYAPISQYPT